MGYVMGWYGGKNRRLYSKKCETCGTDFHVPQHILQRRKHCSRSCHSQAVTSTDQYVCASCGHAFVRPPSKARNSKSGLQFCSRECKEKAQSIGGIATIQPDHYRDGASVYRQRALRSSGRCCKRCGYEADVRMLDVHHSDGDRSNGDISNLEVLCVWCHALETRRVGVHSWDGTFTETGA